MKTNCLLSLKFASQQRQAVPEAGFNADFAQVRFEVGLVNRFIRVQSCNGGTLQGGKKQRC